MNIPDEVIDQEPLLVHGMRRQGPGSVAYLPKRGAKSGTSAEGFLREMEDYTEAVAEWARKEALREAATVAEQWGEKNEVGGYTRAAFMVAVAIRALAEGAPDGQQ